MSSRTSINALKSGSPNAKFLHDFLEYLDEWENHAKLAGGGFLTANTTLGLRVSIKSTLDLLSYLNSNVGSKCLLTSHLSQDKLENLFGIIRQSSGCNDHPTVSQFLITVNLLAFYNLARPPKGGNCSPQVIKSHLSTADAPKTAVKSSLERIDELLDNGNVDGAEEILESIHS